MPCRSSGTRAPCASASSATIAEHLKEGLTACDHKRRSLATATRRAAIAAAAKKIEAVYSTPFLSHACMETMNATVRIAADKAEVWVPTQNAEVSLAALSEESGVPHQPNARSTSTTSAAASAGAAAPRITSARRWTIAKELPGRPDQAHLEPRGGPGARLLPADLAVRYVRRPR